MSSNSFEPYDVEAEDARSDLKLRLHHLKQSLQSQEGSYERTKHQIRVTEAKLKALPCPGKTDEAQVVDTGPHDALSQATLSAPLEVDLPSIPKNQDTPEDVKHHIEVRDEEVAKCIQCLHRLGLQPEQLGLTHTTPSHSQNSQPLSAEEQDRTLKYFITLHDTHKQHVHMLESGFKFLRDSGQAKRASLAKEELEYAQGLVARGLADVMELAVTVFRRIYKGLLQCQYAQDENQEKLDDFAHQRSLMRYRSALLEEKISRARALAKELENEKKRLVKELHDLCARLLW